MSEKVLKGKSEEEIRKMEQEVRCYLINCEFFEDLKITLTPKGRENARAFSILGMSSKEKIGTALRSVRRSPFRTVFVVDEESGKPLFALTRNEEYVAFARRRNPPPDPPTPPSYCCAICGFMGGTDCIEFSDGSCYCIGADRVNDALETIPNPGF